MRHYLPETEHVCEGSYCVPRSAMPQVDEKDMAQLLGHLLTKGISFKGAVIDPLDIHSHQQVDYNRLATMPDAAMQKPILVAADMRVIDGNHRRMAHVIKGTACPCIVIDEGFEEAISAIFECPCTYSYGDGKYHPITY